jgi:hypothetical protein
MKIHESRMLTIFLKKNVNKLKCSWIWKKTIDWKISELVCHPSFHFILLKWNEIIISFGKFIKMTGYQQELRLGMGWNTCNSQLNSHTNFVQPNKIILGITNEFFDSNPKWREPNSPFMNLENVLNFKKDWFRKRLWICRNSSLI